MRISQKLIRKISLCCSFIVLNSTVYALNFDYNLLHGVPHQNINFDDVLGGKFTQEGEYYLEVYLNNRYITRSKVYVFKNNEALTNQNVCIPFTSFKAIDFKEDVVKHIDTSKDCIESSYIDTQIHWKTDLDRHRLDISSPQSFINERPRDYIDPILWEDGISSGFIRYNYNFYEFSYNNQKTSKYDFLNLDAGINLGSWQLRHSGNTSFLAQEKKYTTNETKLIKAFPEYTAQLVLGDFYSYGQGGDVNSTVSLRGLQFSTDEQMLPSSVRSFAPVITGYANTNALVRVKQDNQILFEKAVPSGSFSIGDMYSPVSSGPIFVEIIESNGEIKSFSIPYNSFIRVLRPGQYRYNLALGQYRQNNDVYNEKVLSLSGEYGLNNIITLYSSLLLSDNYLGTTVGGNFNTYLGGVSLFYNYMNANLHNEFQDSDYIGFKYNTLFNQKTNLAFGYTRYLDDQYYSFNDVMNIHYLNTNDSLFNLYDSNQREKASFYTSISHYFGRNFGTLSANYSESQYWFRPSQISYQLTYSNQLNRLINYSIGVQHLQSVNRLNNDSDTQVVVSLNMPLDIAKKRATLSYSGSYAPHAENFNTHKLGIASTLGEYDQIGYGINFNQNSNQESISTSLNYRSSPVLLSTTYSSNFKDSQQYSIQAQGAIVAHKYGITLSNEIGNTYGIVRAKGLEGVHLKNGLNSKVDYWGNAIVPHLIPYQYNNIQVDSQTLPLNVDIDSTSKQVLPKNYTSSLITFNTNSSQKALIDLVNENVSIPLGAQVFNEKELLVGVVGQGQQIYLEDVQATNYKVQWEQQHCNFSIEEQDLLSTSLPFLNLSVTCK